VSDVVSGGFTEEPVGHCMPEETFECVLGDRTDG